MSSRRIALVAVWGAVQLAACGSGPSPDDVIVFAAASLTESFDDLANAYRAAHPGAEVVLNFAGTPTLAAQIRAGAPFDVFAAADERWMGETRAAGLIEPPVGLATNRLVVVTPSDDPAGVGGVDGLARPGLKVVLAQADVPAGRYAREALAGLGIAQAVEANVVSETPDVKGVVSAVALGEADAGIVYASDVTPAVRERVRVFPLPERVDVRVHYPIAIAAEPPHPAAARAFLALARGEAGRRVLAGHGFGPP